MRTVVLPFDYDRYPEYRRLERILLEKYPYGVFLASYLVHRLWVEFGYQSLQHPVACLPKEDFEYFHGRLNVEAHGLTAEILRDLLLTSQILKESDNFYVCVTFQRVNEQHLRDNLPGLAQLRVWEHSQYAARSKKAYKTAEKDIERIAPECFGEVDGKTMSAAEKNTAVATIRVIDSITCSKPRRIEDFEAGVLHDACRFTRRFDRERVDLILRRFMARRTEAGVPRTAEQILSNLDEFLVRIEPEVGWVSWAKLRRNDPKTAA